MDVKYFTPIATAAGGLLAIMIFVNGILSSYTTPLLSSLVVHIIGFLMSLVLWKTIGQSKKKKLLSTKAPLWAYFGGFSGALSVLTANIAVNSPLGLAGSLSLFILGQTITSLIIDNLGLFQSPKRSLTLLDVTRVCTILSGSLLIINSGGK